MASYYLTLGLEFLALSVRVHTDRNASYSLEYSRRIGPGIRDRPRHYLILYLRLRGRIYQFDAPHNYY